VVSRLVGWAGRSCGMVLVEGVVWFGNRLQLGQMTCVVVLLLSGDGADVACEVSGGLFEPIALVIAPVF